MAFDVTKIREDFPILKQKVHNKPLVYLDNGATTQKPSCVLDEIAYWHNEINSNIHRGIHHLSQVGTLRYEEARKTVQQFINAKHSHEVVFTKGATDSINTIAFSFGEKYISEGDEIIITEMEHHANIVPWQMLCKRKNAKLKYLTFNDDGELDVNLLKQLISDKTKLVSVVHVSNSLGTVNPIKEIIDISHQKNIPVLIDGAQSVQHFKIDVQELDCDFFVFSGHKIYGPTGIGALYGKEKWLNELDPYQGGGDMVDIVTMEETTYNVLPHKFEAGTPNFVGATAMATGIKYIQNIGIENIAEYEKELLDYATSRIKEVEDVIIYGNAKEKSSILSFNLKNAHSSDIGMIIDKMGIAVRTGTHCTQPVMQHFDIPGTVRASLVFYNTREEVDIFIDAVKMAQQMLA